MLVNRREVSIKVNHSACKRHLFSPMCIVQLEICRVALAHLHVTRGELHLWAYRRRMVNCICLVSLFQRRRGRL